MEFLQIRLGAKSVMVGCPDPADISFHRIWLRVSGRMDDVTEYDITLQGRQVAYVAMVMGNQEPEVKPVSWWERVRRYVAR